MKRCEWANRDPLEMIYHDTEWGIPHTDDAYLFELLVLEMMQAGLSWTTILRKRETMRTAFWGFDPKRCATMTATDVMELLNNPGVIRHRLKLEALRFNARGFIAIQDELGSFSNYIWGFVEGIPLDSSPNTLADVPAETPLSRLISKDLKKRGFKFLGPTTVYAYLQAIGIVNDHVVDCIKK